MTVIYLKKRSKIFLKTLKKVKQVTKIKKTFVNVELKTFISTVFNSMPNI